MSKILGIVSSSKLQVEPDLLFVATTSSKKCYGTYNGVTWKEIVLPLQLASNESYMVTGKISKSIVAARGSNIPQNGWLYTEDFKLFSSHPSQVLVGESPYYPFSQSSKVNLIGDVFLDYDWYAGYYLHKSLDGKTFTVAENYLGFFEKNPRPGKFISYENGVYTALLSNGYVATSPDGKIWTNLAGPIPVSQNSLATNSKSNSLKKNLNLVTFVSVGNEPGTWTLNIEDNSISQQTTNLPTGYYGSVFVLKNGTFVTYGQVGGNIAQPIRYSADGVTWTSTDITPPNGSYFSALAAYSDDKIMIIDGSEHKTYMSSNGVDWILGSGWPGAGYVSSLIGKDTYV